MNKRIAFLAIGVAVTLPLSGVLAQTSVAVKPISDEAGQKRAEIQTRKEELQAKKAELTANAEQKRAEIQTRKEELKSEMAELKAQRKENREQWCKNVQTRIDTRVGRYENNQAMYQKVYANMQSRLTRLSQLLASKGGDVTKLNADIATLSGLITKLDNDYAVFVGGLKETQTVTCAESDGEFKKQLGGARNVIPAIKADRQAIKDFYQGTIKADLQTIRQALAALNPEDGEETEVEGAPKAPKKTIPATTTTTEPVTTTATEPSL